MGGDTADGGPEARGDFFERVWDVVARVPEGRVTTYGHIAAHLGTKGSARAVGYALNAVVRSDAGPLAVPCHRVVNRFGALSGRMHFDTPHAMEERLRAEGVAFTDDGCVDLEKHLWIPGGRGQRTARLDHPPPASCPPPPETIPPPARPSRSSKKPG